MIPLLVTTILEQMMLYCVSLQSRAVDTSLYWHSVCISYIYIYIYIMKWLHAVTVTLVNIITPCDLLHFVWESTRATMMSRTHSQVDFSCLKRTLTIRHWMTANFFFWRFRVESIFSWTADWDCVKCTNIPFSSPFSLIFSPADWGLRRFHKSYIFSLERFNLWK